MSTTLRPLCLVSYTRPNGQILHCNYLAEHPNDHHSWWAAECQDQVASLPDDAPTLVQTVLDAISKGEMDLYLEALLAVAHNRKRTLRGVAGFARGPLASGGLVRGPGTTPETRQR